MFFEPINCVCECTEVSLVPRLRSSPIKRLLLHRANHHCPPTQHLLPLDGSQVGRPALSLTQEAAPPKTADSNPTPQRRSVQQHPQSLVTMARTQLPHHSAKFLHLPQQNFPPRNKPLTRRPSPLSRVPNFQGPNSPATISKYWTKSLSESNYSNIYTFRTKFWHEFHTKAHASAQLPAFEGCAVEIDGDGNCFARVVARALGLPSYKDVKERTKTFFLEHLPAFSIIATGAQNTDFNSEHPALTELLDHPNPIQEMNHLFSTDGVFVSRAHFPTCCYGPQH